VLSSESRACLWALPQVVQQRYNYK
jgi:hypothetical protein